MMKLVRPCIMASMPLWMSASVRVSTDAGGFVHDEDLRVREHRARQADELLLPDREQHAAFAHLFVVALLEAG